MDDGNNLQALFQPEEEEENRDKAEVEGTEETWNQLAKESMTNGTEQKVADENGAEAPPETPAK